MSVALNIPEAKELGAKMIEVGVTFTPKGGFASVEQATSQATGRTGMDAPKDGRTGIDIPGANISGDNDLKARPPRGNETRERGTEEIERNPGKGSSEREEDPAAKETKGNDTKKSKGNYEKMIKQFMDFDHNRDHDGKKSLGETGKHIHPAERKMWEAMAVAVFVKKHGHMPSAEGHEIDHMKIDDIRKGVTEISQQIAKAGEQYIKNDPNLKMVFDGAEKAVEAYKTLHADKEREKGTGQEAAGPGQKEGKSAHAYKGMGDLNEGLDTKKQENVRELKKDDSPSLGNLKADVTPSVGSPGRSGPAIS